MHGNELLKMSCNGCRVLRKGCKENCILRESLRGIESPQAQANATLFVAKFFGRAGLISFLSAVPEAQRPALFQSLLFEACGRTVNPVNGAVGLLGTGNWHLCQSAVETVLRGGVLRAVPEFSGESPAGEIDDAPETNNIDLFGTVDLQSDRIMRPEPVSDPDLYLSQSIPARMTAVRRVSRLQEKRRTEAPPLESEESETTTFESGLSSHRNLQGRSEAKLLILFS